jgi:hypothetical protein
MNEFNCPHCGRLISVSKHDTAYGVPWRPMRTLSDSSVRYGDVARTQPATPEFSEAYRDTPARPPSVEADWSVPVRRAFMTGTLFGPVIGGVVGIVTPEVNFWHDLLWGLVITGGTVAASWLFFLSRSDSTLWIREKIINKNINKDNHAGKPPTIRIEYEDKEDGRDSEIWADFTVPYKTQYAGAISFANAVVHQNESFSERTAADYGYTRDEWRKLRDMFISNNWASWNHPTSEQQGVTLHGPGRIVLRRVAREGMPRKEWADE